MVLQGKNLFIKVGGVAIAAARSCSVNVSSEPIGICSPSDGEWEHSIMGRRRWSVSTSHLVMADTSSATPIKTATGRVGQTYTLSVECAGLSADIVRGQAHCAAFRVTGTLGNLMQGAFEWKGTGPLE